MPVHRPRSHPTGRYLYNRLTLHTLRWERALILLAAALVVFHTARFLSERDLRPRAAAIAGRIVFEGRPVANAEVSIHGLRQVTRTDAFGRFEMRHVPIGCVTVLARAGSLRAGWPVKLGAGSTRNLGTLALYRWHPDPATGRHGHEPSDALIYVGRD